MQAHYWVCWCKFWDSVISSYSICILLSGFVIIRGFCGVEKPFLFTDLAALTAKSENKKGFSTSEKVGITFVRNSSSLDLCRKLPVV